MMKLIQNSFFADSSGRPAITKVRRFRKESRLEAAIRKIIAEHEVAEVPLVVERFPHNIYETIFIRSVGVASDGTYHCHCTRLSIAKKSAQKEKTGFVTPLVQFS